MKIAIIAVVALAAVAQGFVLPEQGVELNGNVIDKLVRGALESIRTLLKKNPVLTLPEIPEITINDGDVNLRFTVSNAKVSKADDFVVKKIENNLPNLWAKFEVKAPQPHIETDFTIEGSGFGKKVGGTGKISVDVINMDQSGFIQVKNVDHALQIQDMTLDYTLENIKFAISGLDVEGMTEAEINDFLNTKVMPSLDKQKEKICKKVAEKVKELGNQFMAGKTLAQIIAWLKNFNAGQSS